MNPFVELPTIPTRCGSTSGGFGPDGTSGMSARTAPAPPASRVSLTRNSVAGGGGVYGRNGAGFDSGVRQPTSARTAARNVSVRMEYRILRGSLNETARY